MRLTVKASLVIESIVNEINETSKTAEGDNKIVAEISNMD